LVRHLRRHLLETLEPARQCDLAIDAAELDEDSRFIAFDASLDDTHVLRVEPDDCTVILSAPCVAGQR
jgi:hypothetical protein